jgi:hypothetical protein
MKRGVSGIVRERKGDTITLGSFDSEGFIVDRGLRIGKAVAIVIADQSA